MDVLAAQGAVFTQAIAPHVPTGPAHTTLYTGLDVFGHKIASHIPAVKLDRRILMLPQILQRNGYVTAAVDNMVTLCKGRGSWFARGYDYYSGFSYSPKRTFGGRWQSEIITRRSVELLELLREERFFFFVHYWDPHTPYKPPPKYDRMFYRGNERDPAHKSMEQVYARAPEYYRALAKDMGMDGVTDLDYPISQYDAEIHTVDEQIGRVLKSLASSGIADRTLVIIMSDHGEAFGEGGCYFDHHGLSDAVLRIALLLRLPGYIEAGKRIQGMTATYDLAPTILDLLGLDPPYDLPYELAGRSLWPLLGGHAAEIRDRLVVTEATRQGSYGIRTPIWKLVAPVVRNLEGDQLGDLHGHPRDPRPMLFNLPSDRAEMRNVYGDHPDVAANLEADLREAIQEGIARWGGPDPVAQQTSPNGFATALSKVQERVGDAVRPRTRAPGSSDRWQGSTTQA